MSESFEDMLNEFENKSSREKEGVIVKFEDEKVLVDIGEKVEGILDKNEIIDENGELLFNRFDKIPVVIKARKSRAILSYKAALRDKMKKEFIEKHNEGDLITAKITKLNKGGFVAVNDENVEFFVPKSESALKFDESNIGKEITGKIIEIKNNSVVLSRKTYVNEQKEKRNQYVESIKETVFTTKVKNVKREGLVIDLGDYSGFVPKDEIFYKNINHMSLIQPGEEFSVKLIDVVKLLFSIKQTMPNPWEEVKNSGLTKGDVIKNVVVTNIKQYGAFVDIGNGVEGFLHISEISWNSDAQVTDYINVGDEIDVEIISMDIEEEKLRVSYKNLREKPAETFTKTHKIDDEVEGKIVSVSDIGGFVDVEGIVCFLPNRFVSWTKGEKAKDILNVGDEFRLKVINIDAENNKVILSKKDLEDSPYTAFGKKYTLGDAVEGTIKNITEFGVFVVIEGIEALVRKSDLSEPIESYDKQDPIKGEIIELNVDTKRVKLSERNLKG